MKEVKEYKGIKIYFTDNFDFECKIDNEDYLSNSYLGIKDIIDSLILKQKQTNINFVFSNVNDEGKVRQGVIKRLYYFDNKNLGVLFDCENVSYKGKLHSCISNNSLISISDIQTIGNNNSANLKVIEELIVDDGNMKNNLIEYKKIINAFESKVNENNRTLLNLIF